MLLQMAVDPALYYPMLQICIAPYAQHSISQTTHIVHILLSLPALSQIPSTCSSLIYFQYSCHPAPSWVFAAFPSGNHILPCAMRILSQISMGFSNNQLPTLHYICITKCSLIWRRYCGQFIMVEGFQSYWTLSISHHIAIMTISLFSNPQTSNKQQMERIANIVGVHLSVHKH